MTVRAYLVDDEPLAIARLARLLDDTGRVEVIGSATDPEEAVAALASTPPDVCFLDIHMPGLSGLDVQTRLCEAEAAIPVVFVTASDDVALDRSVRQAGGVRLLRKPFSNDDLLEAVGEALQRKARDVS